jgi:hypothetical protein
MVINGIGLGRKILGKFFVSFYQKLFQTEGMVGIEECLEGLEPQVTSEMNGWLLRPFVVEEVDYALSRMHPLKSPGPILLPVSIKKHGI